MKNKIRKTILEMRLKMPCTSIEALSKLVIEKLITLPEFNSSKSILLYLPIKNEVNTGEIVNIVLKAGKDLSLPVIMKKSLEIEPFYINSLKDVSTGSYNLLEPNVSICKRASAANIELVIVPGIAFDLYGNRIGFGMGFYDKFLRKLSPETKTIALAFDFQIVNKIDSEKHDVKVNKLITEKRVINFEN